MNLADKNIIYVTADWHGRRLGNASEPRVGEPVRALSRHGYRAMVSPNFSYHPDGSIYVKDGNGERHYADILVLHRVMRHDMPERVKKARAAGQVVMSEIDDWFFGIPWYNVAFWGSHPKRDPNVNRSHYQRILSNVDAVITSTPYLRDRLHGLMPHQHIYVAKNGVDVKRFADVATANLYHHDRAGSKPTVGWRGGVPWREGDLMQLKGVFGPFMDKHGLEFIHSGFGALQGQKPVPASHIMGWYEDEKVTIRGSVGYPKFPELLRNFQVGLIPLADNPFNRSKSCLAALEYMAASVPFVAGNTDEYRHLRDRYGCGRVARNPKQWRKHLQALLDPDTRIAEAQNQLDAAWQFDVDTVMWTQWRDIFDDMLKG